MCSVMLNTINSEPVYVNVVKLAVIFFSGSVKILNAHQFLI